MKCECEDWLQNIDKLNAPFLLAAARSGNWRQYDGKPFCFCPWCSNELIDDEHKKPEVDLEAVRGILAPPNDQVQR